MIREVIKKEDGIIIQSDTGNYTAAFPRPVKIEKTIIFNGAILALVWNESDRNIYRISEDGKIVWQIGQPTPFRNPERSACFTNVWVDKATGSLKAGSLNDHDYDVDFETGQLSNEVYTK